MVWAGKPGLLVGILGAGLVAAGAGLCPARAGEALAAGSAFDAAPFGYPVARENGKAFGVRWGEPRKIRRVEIEFGERDAPPDPAKIRVQYWHAVWDGRPDPVAGEKGAGHVGWERMDDWTNGKWRDADVRLEAEGHRWAIVFAPTGEKEFPDLRHPGVGYRRTIKLRLVSGESLPEPVRFQAFTDAVYQPLTARILFGRPAHPGVRIGDIETGHLEAFNGAILAVRPIGAAEVSGGEPEQWKLPAIGEAGIEADVLMAVDVVNPQYDRTVVTVRSKDRPFSFAADEVARGDRVLVDDLGTLVVRGNDPTTVEGYREQRKEFPGRTVYSRIFNQPEQTLGRSWDAMPLKRPLYFVHGLPGNRNAMHQIPNGEIVIAGKTKWFRVQASPRDSERKGWGGPLLRLGFGFPTDHEMNRRELKDGYLPLLTTWYRDDVLSYEQTTILDALDADMANVGFDDPSVLLMRVRIVNTSGDRQGTASLFLASWPSEGSEKVSVDGDRVTAATDSGPRFRYLFKSGARGQFKPEGDGLRWTLALGPGEAHDLYCFIPSITLDQDKEIVALAKRDFAADADRVCRYWADVTGRGSTITTPEPWLNDFYKAHVRHLLVNCYKELDSDRLHAHVGTFYYGVFPDESVMMTSDLDRRGYHDEARRCYDAFLHYQGTVALPGNYKSSEGLFYGSGGHQQGGYNKNHGWVMWGIADHWRHTRDRDWMAQAGPKLVAACEWVIRERQATMRTNPDGSRPIEYGFLPPGSLEDVTDYWYWMVTNACTDWGMQALTEALADFGHPEADRLRAEAKAFHEDLMRGLEESRVRTPVVRLRDGTYVPKYPSRLYERGRCHGWLRETLEGSIHLLITDLLPQDSPQAKWIIDDFEDNLYISDDYGYAIPSFDAFWFSRGGFSMQANLLGGPLPYLYRDEIKHFLRAYFNSLTSAFYPDIRMCNEHSLPELGYPRGDHFKSSDEAQSTYWLRLMFVHERGGDLYLGQAIPRYWLTEGRSVAIERAATYFGPLSVRITSRASAGEMQADLSLPRQWRTRPGQVYLRLRHPEGKPIRGASVNGRDHADFDAAKEWIRLPPTVGGELKVIARY